MSSLPLGHTNQQCCVLHRGFSVSLSSTENAVEQSYSRSYGSVACVVNKCYWVKPLRFGGCLFLQYNLVYPNWYGHLGNHGQREGPRVPKIYLTNYVRLAELALLEQSSALPPQHFLWKNKSHKKSRGTFILAWSEVIILFLHVFREKYFRKK